MKHVYTFLFSCVFLAIEAKHRKRHNSSALRHRVDDQPAKPHKDNVFGFNSKHVNLSLETAFVFDPKDTYYDVSLLRTFRGFLDSLQNAMESKMSLRTMPDEHYLLPEFLYELGGHLIGYSDEDLRTFVYALKDVVEDYFPAGTIYHKIFYDPRLKSFIKNTLTEWTATDPKELRAAIKAMYQGPTYDEVFVDLVEALTCIFDEGRDSKVLRKLAKKFEKFPKKKQTLEKFIDATLNFIIFKRYQMLNSTMRAVVIEELSKIAEYVAMAYKERSHDPEFFVIRKIFTGDKMSSSSDENEETSLSDGTSSDSSQQVTEKGLELDPITEITTHVMMNNTEKIILTNNSYTTYTNTTYKNITEKNITEENMSNNRNSRNDLINATVTEIAEEIINKPLKKLVGNARKIFEAKELNSFERITKSSSEENSAENKVDDDQEIQEGPNEMVFETAFAINVHKTNEEDFLKLQDDEDLIDHDSVMFRA